MQKRIFRLATDVTVPKGADTIDYQPKDRFVSSDTRIPLTGLWLLTKILVISTLFYRASV